MEQVTTTQSSLKPLQTHVRAFQMLALCTALWGLSFPAMKALSIGQQQIAPEISTWFITGLSVVIRFALAALIVLPFVLLGRPVITPSEIKQGLILGFIGGLGILLQMDGLSHTSASTSAFLTQFYCVILPLWAALKTRTPPSFTVISCCLLVLIGVGILANVDWKSFRLGRGELETLLASIIFTGQILWLEHPGFAKNRTLQFSLVMFLAMAATGLPIAIATSPTGTSWPMLYMTKSAISAMMLLVLLSTIGGYLIMNHWQKHIPATHAGLIYCLEPVFASGFALFIPGLFALHAGINYANEELGPRLVAGGGLVTIANLLLQWRGGTSSQKS